MKQYSIYLNYTDIVISIVVLRSYWLVYFLIRYVFYY
jgi:hypothetical protein